LPRSRVAAVRTALILALALAGHLALSAIMVRPASATLDSCAVVNWTSDGFLSLRTGPGVHFPEIMRIASGTVIGIDDPPHDPSGRWVHVFGVYEGGRLVRVDGWVNQRYIRGSLDCPG
jgi:uncharacterized protein YraI